MEFPQLELDKLKEGADLKRKKNLLYYIYCALGEKTGKTDTEADKVAFIRLLMFLSILITNCFIIFNAVRTHIFPAPSKPIDCRIIQ